MKKAIALIILSAAAFVAGYGWGRWYGPRDPHAGHRMPQKTGRYHCPMHPSYTSDRQGECPICGMRLVPIDKRAEPDQASELPPGVFHVPTERQQLAGVRYGVVEASSATRTIRAVGKVEIDETKIARIHPRIEGWIEEVFVDFTGKFVEKGQPLLSVYSPELLATQQEYLLALRARRTLVSTSGAAGDATRTEREMERREMTTHLVDAARRRLELWDVSRSEIEELERTGIPKRTVTLYSPITGYVTARKAFPKQRVMPDTELYSIVDLSRVWVMADVFESEAAAIRVGQPAVVSLAYGSAKTFAARVSYIQPSVDPSSRTLKVRLEVDNPGLILKLEMFVNVEFRIAEPHRITVPMEAVLDSGLSKTVFVDRGNGHVEPREVETGPSVGDRVVILRGLKPGERIVTSGAFLIDSESRLKAAVSGMAGHQHSTPAQPAREAGGHVHD